MATLAWTAAVAVVVLGCQGKVKPQATGNEPPRVVAESELEAGRYLVIAGGCNDCHTDNYERAEGKIPESKWLLGSSVGWRGPWGTSYGTNLRLRVHEVTEEAWMLMMRKRMRPPMPWTDTKELSDADLRALYVYIRSLGPAGKHTPAALGPGEKPTTPYIDLTPIMPGAAQLTREQPSAPRAH